MPTRSTFRPRSTSRRRRRARLNAALGAAALTLGLLLATMSPPASAQSTGGPYTMRKQVVAGGMRAQGGAYVLTGTAQQPIAFTQSAGPYRVTGGFHSPGPLPEQLLCDGFENVPCTFAAAAAAVAVPASASDLQE